MLHCIVFHGDGFETALEFHGQVIDFNDLMPDGVFLSKALAGLVARPLRSCTQG